MKSMLLVVLVLVLVVTGATARTWCVKPDGTGDAPTIQAGLDSAGAGDTVFVTSGWYDVDIVFWPDRNGIVLAGAGIESTIVSGDRWQAALYIASAVPIDSSTVVTGISLRNGGDAGIILYGTSPVIEACAVDSSTNGPGIYAVYGSGASIRLCSITGNSGPGIRADSCDMAMTIDMNLIKGNSATATQTTTAGPTPIYPNGFVMSQPVASGGGVYCRTSPIKITSNTIEGNLARSGGGISCNDSCFVSQNRIVGNAAISGSGGGIYCIGPAAISGNNIEDNSSSGTGGGIYCIHGPNIGGNLIRGNSASAGGGVYAPSATSIFEIVISGNSIIGNSASGYGGGVYVYDDLSLVGNQILHNSAQFGGGACSGSTPEVSGNVFADNNATYDGGAIYSVGGSFSLNTLTRNVCDRNGAGVCVYDAEVFERNTLTENCAGELGDGFYLFGNTVTVVSCNIAHNSWGMHNGDPVNIPVAQDNWWGHASGPWHQGYNPAGKGDSLSAYAWKFQPWLTEADTIAPPMPPVGLDTLLADPDTTTIVWRSVPIEDIAGYRVYFDTQSPEPPYSDTVDVGSDTTFSLQGPLTRHYVAVTCYDNSGGESWYSRYIAVWPGGTAAVADESPAMSDLDASLAVCPNPVLDKGTIIYNLGQAAHVEISIYGIGGRLVRTLECRHKNAGSHSVALSTDGLGAGVYFCRLEAGGYAETVKMLLID